MAYRDLVNRFSTTRLGSWLARTVSARLDPWLFTRTGGRWTSVGHPTIPQITLATTGRTTGERREVQLAYLADGDDYVVVASNFGQAHHPGWMYNLEADPRAQVFTGTEWVDVMAEQVAEDDKAALWPRLCEVVPQFDVYVTRTDRSIRVFRLHPA